MKPVPASKTSAIIWSFSKVALVVNPKRPWGDIFALISCMIAERRPHRSGSPSPWSNTLCTWLVASISGSRTA